MTKWLILLSEIKHQSVIMYRMKERNILKDFIILLFYYDFFCCRGSSPPYGGALDRNTTARRIQVYFYCL